MANKGCSHLDATTGKVPVLESAGSAILGLVTGINLMATGPTTLYTVPAGKTLYLTDVILIITSADTFATPVTLRIGKSAAYTEWLAASALTGLDTAGEFVSLGSLLAGLLHSTFAATEVVALDVTVGAGAVALTATAIPIGFLV